ncbi:hypothetical protein QBC47DRAFT_354840 [Echria macrotheca]|uniref:Uncharacterized protein n=1 Tax=Echria macrotheca TaxID=438768 RepID=A0AAJ0B110_9PEZI|nr:hypothetical protein QBC47DRAFT_354840 [Echria macrotheca]
MPSVYFETITSKQAFRRHAGNPTPLYCRQQHELPAASDWSTQELFASRVVVHNVRGGVLKHRIPHSSSGFLRPPPRQSSAELSKIIVPLPPGDQDLTETELIHRLGGTAGMFWAALLHSFASDNAGHVSREEHAAWAMSEDATVQLASTFLRHALVHCPLQEVTAIGPTPQLLLEFSGIRRRMLTHFGEGTLELEATADGEVALLRKDATGRFVHLGQAVMLLEAKKRFELVREGKPLITDNVLGQMLAEALTLRLSFSAAESGYFEDTIVIVAATRQYLCFISFYIPDPYVEKLQKGSANDDMDVEPPRYDSDEDGDLEYEGEEGKGGEEDDEFITVRATDWLDLSTERCRQLACDNISALVDWQLNKIG